VSTKESAHIDQATQAAVRALIPPTPRYRSFVPSVTTPLYSTQRLPSVTANVTKPTNHG
jgi:hypothetical protein